MCGLLTFFALKIPATLGVTSFCSTILSIRRLTSWFVLSVRSFDIGL